MTESAQFKAAPVLEVRISRLVRLVWQENHAGVEENADANAQKASSPSARPIPVHDTCVRPGHEQL
eukprot:6173917-Pleurochrysis_carterae.AAC.1